MPMSVQMIMTPLSGGGCQTTGALSVIKLANDRLISRFLAIFIAHSLSFGLLGKVRILAISDKVRNGNRELYYASFYMEARHSLSHLCRFHVGHAR